MIFSYKYAISWEKKALKVNNHLKKICRLDLLTIYSQISSLIVYIHHISNTEKS